MNGRRLYVGMLGMLLLVGCNDVKGLPDEKAEIYDENHEIIGDEKQEIIGKTNPVIFESFSRKKHKATNKTMELDIEKIEQSGIHLPTGRYQLSGDVTGRILVFDANGKEVFQELINQQGGVESVVLNIENTYTIKADGFINAYALPVDTKYANELSAGLWEVGKDIKPGEYDVSADAGLGHLQVLEKDGKPRLYELISSKFVNTKSEIQLQAGQILKITGVNSVRFEKH